MIQHSATWTSERVEQLKSCFNAGFSCSQIAREIGVSRNAVIGKMSRMGLSRPKDIAANRPGRKPATSLAKALRAKAWRPRMWDRIHSTHERVVLTVASEPRTVEPIALGHGCSLLELGQGKCRWPINEPGAEDFRFCGNAPVEGLPYCLGHARLAYRPAGRQRHGTVGV
jgi:GcrA cell cycle regulator